MSETIVVPLEIPAPKQEQAQQEKPALQRRSLHNVKMGQALFKPAEVETTPDWTGRGFTFRDKPVAAPEPPPQPVPANDAMQAQINTLTQAVQHLAGIQPPNSGPLMPNPADYDFYDPQQEGEYHQALQEYVNAVSEQKVAAAMEPHREAIAQTELQNLIIGCMEEFGSDQNLLTQALQLCAESGGKLSLRDAYISASDPTRAAPGERGNMNLPEALKGRGKKIGRISLRDIVIHNQLSGRAAPTPQKKGWW
jgi:hypothetical protein